MKISQDTVVELEYTLTVDGEVVDRSEPGEPLIYLHGHDNIIPGLERALEGQRAGDTLHATVLPEDGYGAYSEDLVEQLAREDFEDDIEVGAAYYTPAEDGRVLTFTVLEVNGERVKVDFNPPLAGRTLDFEVTVVSVRGASAEELEYGHASLPPRPPGPSPDLFTADSRHNGGLMKITQDTVVEIDYTLTVDGEIVDRSEPGEPLTYLQGHSNIIPGLERALEGKMAGDMFQEIIQPEDGYGPRDEDNVEELAREDFEDDVEIGETYYAQAEDGSVIPFTVLEIDGDNVKVDFNPPLAGQVLTFDVTVVGVREATAEELEHGHAHTPEMEHDHG
ncbi:hypothetical protein GCM10010841_16830 [Deinococcus aerophilus]|uniref:peptidylprolyl isomerase n=2 Tax=Deinococcus aerophilus TaxID=522488 RepID=A0ABQ2GSC4_9DEIO|nr:hypothetical protein GCM10010841_16830 [Deinococcus aerophilus]